MAADVLLRPLVARLGVFRPTHPMKDKTMNNWFWYAVGAAVLYGAHQIFTKLASNGISDGLGGFVVEGSAALTILAYLAWQQGPGGCGPVMIRVHSARYGLGGSRKPVRAPCGPHGDCEPVKTRSPKGPC